jgi:hypothetical protein
VVRLERDVGALPAHVLRHLFLRSGDLLLGGLDDVHFFQARQQVCETCF